MPSEMQITHLLIPHQLLHSNRWHAGMQFSMDKGVTRKSCSFHPFKGFLCNFLVFPLLYGAPSGTTADKVAASMPFPLQESSTFMISLR